jgi:hypothetical protein
MLFVEVYPLLRELFLAFAIVVFLIIMARIAKALDNRSA